MTEFVEVLRKEHRNIESLLRVLERELEQIPVEFTHNRRA
jgi:hypothetical protein